MVSGRWEPFIIVEANGGSLNGEYVGLGVEPNATETQLISNYAGGAGAGYIPFSIQVGGVDDLTIQPSGNVGIVNRFPAYTLDVKGVAGTTSPFNVASSSGVSELMVSNSGNVGIGTTTPSQLLTVGNNNQLRVDNSGDITSAGTLTLSALIGTQCLQESNGVVSGAGSNCGGGSGGSGAGWATSTPNYICNAQGYNMVGINTTNPAGQLTVEGTSGSTTPILVVATSTNASLFQVNSNGNVGIATSNPTSVFTVASSTNGSNLFTVQSNGNIVYGSAQGVKTLSENILGADGRYLTFGISGSDHSSQMQILSSYNSGGYWPMTFIVGGSSSLFLDTSSHVGINNASPAYSLDVKGTGTQNPFNVASSSGTSELMVASSGNVGIGTTSAQYLLQVGSASVASGTVARFQNANGTCDINPTTNTLACSSDERLKKNITPMTDDLAQVMALQPVYFNWNAENAGTPQHPGFIAQQVQQIMPEVVSTDPATGLLSMGYSGLVPAVVSAMQQMQTEITTLQGGLTGNATTSDLTVYNPSNFSGDSVGEAEILAGQTSVRVSFRQQYAYQPIVTFSPEGSFMPAFIAEKDTSGFTLALEAATSTPTTFDWHSFASPNEQLTVSGGTTRPISLVVASQPPPESFGSGQASIVPAPGDQGASSTPSSGQVVGDATTTPESGTSTMTGSSESSTPDSNASASSSPPSADQSSGAQGQASGTPTTPSNSGGSASSPSTLAPSAQPSADPLSSSATGDSSSETASPPSDASSAAGGSATPPSAGTSATPTTDSAAGSTSP